MSSLRLLFGLRTPVGRLPYLLWGVGLMAFKYGLEYFLLRAHGVEFMPRDFLSPVLADRERLIDPLPDRVGWFQFLWTLPFVWICVSMSVRRCADAGGSAWAGLIVLVPYVNYVLMGVMCTLPTSRSPAWRPRDGEIVEPELRSALRGVLLGLAIALPMVLLSVYVFESYGATLFFATPLIIGAASAWIYNREASRKTTSTLTVAGVSTFLPGLALLLFAFEGAVCLVMAFPIAVSLGIFGGIVGKAIAEFSPRAGRDVAAAVALLPLLCAAETMHDEVPLNVVVTTIEIDAPPEEVWPNVVAFSELPDARGWLFELGLACPLRASIEGEGVGAVRHCEFTTGSFVEPITVWDEPRRLAFDVISQPPPMHEWSPYKNVHPPHLDGYLRSKRGEFRLIPLPGGRTRLEGRTWYELEMAPLAYWRLWSDGMIHTIHDRVLRHVKNLSE